MKHIPYMIALLHPHCVLKETTHNLCICVPCASGPDQPFVKACAVILSIKHARFCFTRAAERPVLLCWISQGQIPNHTQISLTLSQQTDSVKVQTEGQESNPTHHRVTRLLTPVAAFWTALEQSPKQLQAFSRYT